MKKILFILITTFLFPAVLMAYDKGLTHTKSFHSVKNTADRLEKALREKGVTIFARINHTDAAKSIGKILRPTELIIFGNPKVGTLLMQCKQTVAIDLPQKVLIWQDKLGQVWLTYNTPAYLVKRHGIKGCDKAIHNIDNILKEITKAATAQ